MFEESLQLQRAFWERRGAARPLFGIDIGFFLKQRFPRTAERLPEGPLKPDDIPVEAFLQDCDERYQRHLGQGDYPFVSAPFSAGR